MGSLAKLKGWHGLLQRKREGGSCHSFLKSPNFLLISSSLFIIKQCFALQLEGGREESMQLVCGANVENFPLPLPVYSSDQGGIMGVGLWQISNPFTFFQRFCHASSFLSPTPSHSLDFFICSPSAGHLHGLGGTGRHLATLWALGQGAGARAGSIHGVGGRQGGSTGAGQACHARRSHCSNVKREMEKSALIECN